MMILLVVIYIGIPSRMSEKVDICVRGDVKIHWLMSEKLYIAVECCSTLAAASTHEF